jgi:hypothetical protein
MSRSTPLHRRPDRRIDPLVAERMLVRSGYALGLVAVLPLACAGELVLPTPTPLPGVASGSPQVASAVIESLSPERASAVVATLCDAISLRSTRDPSTAAQFEAARRSYCRTELSEFRIGLDRGIWPTCKAALGARTDLNGLAEVLAVPPCRAAVRLEKSAGDRCGIFAGCGDGLGCSMVTFRCERSRAEGQDCVSDEHCAPELWCDRPLEAPAGKCIRRLAIGATCFAHASSLGDCERGAHCVNEHCSRAAGLKGDRCGVLAPDACGDGLSCDHGICGPAHDSGEPCHLPWECRSRECIGDFGRQRCL